MRRLVVIYSVLCALMVVSCRKMPVQQYVAGAIDFVSPQVVTKSELITDKTQMRSGETELAYGVFAARYLPDEQGNITAHDADFMTNLKVYSNLDGEVWHYDGDRYFWSPGAAYKFFAVYPYYHDDNDETTDEDDAYDLGISYFINEEAHALQVTGKHEENDGDELIICTGTDGEGRNHLCPDILYGVSKYSEPYQIGEKRGPVEFTMNHAFAAVSFRFRNASEYTINGIYTYENIDDKTSAKTYMQLTGFDNVADYVLLSEKGAKWVALDHTYAHEFVVPMVEAEITKGQSYPAQQVGDAALPYWYTALVIPQNFGESKKNPSFTFFVDMDTVGEKKYTVNFKDYQVHGTAQDAYSFLPGNRYVYTFNVTATMIVCDVAVVPWIEDEPIQLN